MYKPSIKKQCFILGVFIYVLFSFECLFSQNYIDSLQNVDFSAPSRYFLEWDITRKAPYLIYNGNEGEMQIQWQLSSTAMSFIAWGTDITYSAGSAQTDEYGNDHQHLFTINNLTNATKYFYRVIAGTDTHNGSFYTAPDSTEKKVSFFAYGDTRSYPADHNIIAGRIINEFTTDSAFQSIVISVGDLVSQGDNESDWETQFFNSTYPNIINMLANLPYQSCMGNHEQSGVLFKKYFPYPFVNGRYWSFDYGPAHFVVVDQYTDYSSGSAQLTWIENDLSSSNKPWKFIYLHEPGWSAGIHNNNISVQNYIQPLCEQYRVPIVFGGHNHYYARAEINDVLHITTGGGGAPLYPPTPSYPGIITTAQVHHYCKIEIDNDILYFSAIDENGTEIDNFVLNKYGIKSFNVSVSSPYVRMGLDSLLILTELKNPMEHSVNLQALITGSENTFADSVHLFDDGDHGDGEAGDGIWGNFLDPLPVEDDFIVDIAVTDLDSIMYFVSRNMARFTTIGPLILYDYAIASTDTIPNHGDRLRIQLTLKNSGLTTTAKNITSLITPLDSCASLPVYVIPEYGDITPGGTSMENKKQYIKYSLNCPDSIYARFNINIYSNDILFWSDTFSVFIHKDPTGIVLQKENLIKNFALRQNYPNPFNPITVISYQLPVSGSVELFIYNILGQKVATLVSKKQPAGIYKMEWDASALSSGVYFYKLSSSDFTSVKKMLLVK